jgi:hypothetical protein
MAILSALRRLKVLDEEKKSNGLTGHYARLFRSRSNIRRAL